MAQEYENENIEMKQNENSNYSLYGKKIWIYEKSDFVEAFVFIEGEYIANVLFPSSTNLKFIEEYKRQYPLKYDFGNLFIFPGLVDINVSLQIGSDWEEIEQTTELFLKGGITTIACQPLITNEQFLRDELASIKNKKERMKNKSSVDYCFFANVYQENIFQLEDIYREPGVAGFKIYLTLPFQNGAGWVETKKDMDIVMKGINDLRIKLENDKNSPQLQGKPSQKQIHLTQKSLLVTFHSIKSGDKELTITSPLRQRKIEERCDRTTYIKRTQGDSVLGETHKSLQNLEINFDYDDQFENLSMCQISQCINDNIMNLKDINKDDTSDEDQDREVNESNLNPENEDVNSKQPYIQKIKQQNNQFTEQPQMSSYSNRDDIIKQYAKATISSSENHQIKLIARAEMQTYNSKDDIENNNENESVKSFSSISDQNSENGEENQQKQNKIKEDNCTLNTYNQEQNNSLHLDSEKFDKSVPFFSPFSSPFSNRFETVSPNSEIQCKEDRKKSQDIYDDRKLLELQQFQLQPNLLQDQTININDIDEESILKIQGKFIKVQKVQKNDSCNNNNNNVKDDDKIGSLHKIYENDDSGRDSNSDQDQDDDNSVNFSSNNIQYHKKSCTYQSERSGSGLLSYNTHSLQDSKRGSHDIPNNQSLENGFHINLIKDMKRGSCDKDPPSYLNENQHQFKKSSFNTNKKISSMVDINRKEGQGQALIPPNASKMKLSEKRKSMNLIVHVENNKYSKSPESGMIKRQNYDKSCHGLNDSRDEINGFNIKSSSFLGEETTSLKDIQKKNSIFHPDNNFISQIQSSQQLSQQNYTHNYNIKSTNFLEKTNEKDDFQDYQFSLNTGQEDYSARKLSIDSGSNHSIGNNLLNQSQTSIAGVNYSPQINCINKNKDSFQCQICNENCNCYQNNDNNNNKSKFNQDYLTFLAFRPPYWEYFGIQMIRDSLEKNSNSSKVQMKVLFANIGNSNSMYRITNLKQDLKKKNPNIHLYSETTGAYLYFSSNKIANGQTIFKCEPPIGVRENKEFLINASKLNMVDVVSSYHFPVDEKFKCIEEGDFRKAFSGICTAGCTLQATWTALYSSYKNKKNKSISIQKDQLNENQKSQVLLKYLVNMLCIKPAKILNIHHMKGSIQKGKYADFVIWDPFSPSQKIKIPSTYRFKSVHIFDQKRVYGQVHATIIRGKVVYDIKQSSSVLIKGQGKMICRNAFL